MSDQLARLPTLLTAHLQLVTVALLAGGLISIPGGIWITRHPRWERLALGVASVIQTIPSLALLAVMVPALAALGGVTRTAFGFELRSIGVLPALVALVLYSVLPMLRNTVTGIAGIDPALIEAARGVGMTDRQRLRLVELPLALPVIVAGVRTAAVWVVGMATLSTPVGAPSLGDYIFSGLQTRNFAAVLVGCLASAALALVLDGLVRTLEVGIARRRRGRTRAAALALAALALYAGASFALGLRGRGGREVVIGAKTFTEQYVLSEILARQVERATGRATRIVPSLGSTVAFDALATGAIDAYVDYTGTLWATILHHEETPPDPAAVLAEVARVLADEHRVTVVGALGFENAYALATSARGAAARGLARISDLTPAAPELAMAADYEFFSRPEWQALVRTYGLRFREQRSMDPSLMYGAVASGDVDVISAFSTDGRIAAYGLVVLADDRRAIPPYDAIILASARLVRDEPAAVDALRALAGTIDAATMRAMNAAVDEQGASPQTVAQGFLARLAGAKRAPSPSESPAPGPVAR
jgi:osmoprotectant transport system permease protein